MDLSIIIGAFLRLISMKIVQLSIHISTDLVAAKDISHKTHICDNCFSRFSYKDNTRRLQGLILT